MFHCNDGVWHDFICLDCFALLPQGLAIMGFWIFRFCVWIATICFHKSRNDGFGKLDSANRHKIAES
ncbi:hypothetical protein [Helicobacter sp. 23-1045]